MVPGAGGVWAAPPTKQIALVPCAGLGNAKARTSQPRARGPLGFLLLPWLGLSAPCLCPSEAREAEGLMFPKGMPRWPSVTADIVRPQERAVLCPRPVAGLQGPPVGDLLFFC